MATVARIACGELFWSHVYRLNTGTATFMIRDLISCHNLSSMKFGGYINRWTMLFLCHCWKFFRIKEFIKSLLLQSAQFNQQTFFTVFYKKTKIIRQWFPSHVKVIKSNKKRVSERISTDDFRFAGLMSYSSQCIHECQYSVIPWWCFGFISIVQTRNWMPGLRLLLPYHLNKLRHV